MRDPAILFEPVTVNGTTFPNRIVMAPMGRNFAKDGVPPLGLVDYFARRVRGGVGLCIGEASRVDHPVASNDTLHTAFHGESLDVWRKVVEATHAEGGCFMPQIWHAGLLRPPISDHPLIPNPQLPPMGPSGWAEPLVHTTGWVTPIREAARIAEPMTDSDIADVIASFARAAVAARDMGCDGVNIHGAHGYLLDQFFWDRTNHRQDRYGGDFVNRARFAAELTAAVREATGPDFPIFFRWSQWKQQDYHCKIAETPSELETFLRPLVDAGVDLFDCSTRRFWEPEFEGSPMNLAGWTKKLTGKPTMTVGSVGLERSNFADGGESSMNDSGLASLDPLIERLEKGEFDMVGVGRMLITNPEWANQVRQGLDHEIKPYSNQHLMTLFCHRTSPAMRRSQIGLPVGRFGRPLRGQVAMSKRHAISGVHAVSNVPTPSLNDKVIIVTGAGSGIGRAAAVYLAALGARVVVTDMHVENGVQTHEEIRQSGGASLFVTVDVADEASVRSMVQEAVSKFGRLDGAFNNAGISQSLRKLHEIDTSHWHRLMGVNLTGVFFCMKYQLPAMLANGGGSIVNTASSLGQVAAPYSAEYVAAKHGVIGLTRAAALDYATQNIRVNAILPGVTQTPMLERGPVVGNLSDMVDRIKATIPMQRVGRADEVAKAAAWLLSDAASYVTGALLPVDGGYLVV